MSGDKSPAIVRQLFDQASCSYTYLVGDPVSGEALLIDPVFEQTPLYLQLLAELNLCLRFSVDTHLHADHVTALGLLRGQTGCETVLASQASATGVSLPIRDGDVLTLGTLTVECFHTPGHTNCSYSLYLAKAGLLFTGDTLLIRGTGRTDFQQGCAHEQYRSLFKKLFTLPGETVVFPGHDYRGLTSSTLAEERAHNPRLQVENESQYDELMSRLKLSPPRLIDVALPANLRLGMGYEP